MIKDAIEHILNLFLLQNLKTHIKLNVFKHMYICIFFLIFNYSIKDI